MATPPLPPYPLVVDIAQLDEAPTEDLVDTRARTSEPTDTITTLREHLAKQLACGSIDSVECEYQAVLVLGVKVDCDGEEKVVEISVPLGWLFQSEGASLTPSWVGATPLTEAKNKLLGILQTAVESVGLNSEGVGFLHDLVAIKEIRVLKEKLITNENEYLISASSNEGPNCYRNKSEKSSRPTLGVNIDEKWLLRTHQLRYFFKPDYTIELKSEEFPDKVLHTFRINRYLLGFRIPYFKNLFSSSFGDSDTMRSVFYTDTFTTESLQAICRYTYLLVEPSMELFWYSSNGNGDCGLLQKRVELYIAPAAEDEQIRHRNIIAGAPDSTRNLCQQYFSDLDSEGNLPPLDTIDQVMAVLKAADYLGIDDLRLYMLRILRLLGHNFVCMGKGCASIVPRIMNAAYQGVNMPESILSNAVNHMSEVKAVNQLWKRSLIEVHPDILSRLVENVKENLVREQRITSGKSDPIKDTYRLYASLIRLRQQTSKSKDTAKRWDDHLIVPLLDFCTQQLARNFNWMDHGKSRLSADKAELTTVSISKLEDITKGLLEVIASPPVMCMETCEGIWRGFKNWRVEMLHEEAYKRAVAWFKKNWLTLSVAGARAGRGKMGTDVRGSIGETGEATSTGLVLDTLTSARTEEAGNFFSTWQESDVEALAKEIGTAVEDMLAVSQFTTSSPAKRTAARAAAKQRNLEQTGQVISGVDDGIEAPRMGDGGSGIGRGRRGTAEPGRGLSRDRGPL
ncbi:hypothetical protein BDZ91DRAFT_757573 [Kalaharituber pfeilii]|nr:hypothetical protein BDZ91DRAFT_757573 [Kalaharituber pfeilii]